RGERPAHAGGSPRRRGRFPGPGLAPGPARKPATAARGLAIFSPRWPVISHPIPYRTGPPVGGRAGRGPPRSSSSAPRSACGPARAPGGRWRGGPAPPAFEKAGRPVSPPRPPPPPNRAAHPFRAAHGPLVAPPEHLDGQHAPPVVHEPLIIAEAGGDVIRVGGPAEVPEVRHPAGHGHVAQVAPAVDE